MFDSLLLRHKLRLKGVDIFLYFIYTLKLVYYEIKKKIKNYILYTQTFRRLNDDDDNDNDSRRYLYASYNMYMYTRRIITICFRCVMCVCIGVGP